MSARAQILGLAALVATLAGAARLAPSAVPTTAAAPAIRAERKLPSATAAAASDPSTCPLEPPLDAGALSLPLALVLLAGERPHITGSASIGTPTRGSLWAGVELVESDDIERAGGYPWGTSSTVRSIERAAREVRRCHPGSPRLVVGDLGRQHGGWLRPHRSHQSGLDADIGYFYSTPATWYLRATAANLDVARSWTLVRALIEGGNVDTIFIDASVQRLLLAHVATLADDGRPASEVFATPTRRDAIIRHTWGHATHLHVRFRDPDAQRLGARLERARGRPPRRW